MARKRSRSPSLILADLRNRAASPSLLLAELADLRPPSPPPVIGVPVELATVALVVGVAAVSTAQPNLFLDNERRNYTYVPRRKRKRPVLVSSVNCDGTLQGDCHHCIRSFLSIECFAPMVSNNNARNRPFFFQALQDYTAAYEARDLDKARETRRLVEKYRVRLCPPCGEKNRKRSPAERACKDEWVRMRKEACARQNGCRYPGCAERGPHAWCVLEGDHVHTAKDPDEALRKKKALSEYIWWAGHGGVPAMRAEVAMGMNWPCRFCHTLESTNNASRKCKDPNTMPGGKRSGTQQEKTQYNTKRKAQIKYPKQVHVDARKRDIGCCKLCKRQVLAGQEHAFSFDHIVPSTKLIGNDTLAGARPGGIAGLVNNDSNEAKLDNIKDILDKEMDKCRLLCSNCDHRHTNGYPARE